MAVATLCASSVACGDCKSGIRTNDLNAARINLWRHAVAPKPDEIAEIYIDESIQNNHHYLVVGCVVTMLNEASNLTAMIAKARLPELPAGEVKWSKVSKQNWRRINA